MNRTLISAVPEETRRYLFNASERLILILCCWLLEKTLVITTDLTKPESAPEKSNHFQKGFCNFVNFLLKKNIGLRAAKAKLNYIFISCNF